MFDLFIAGGGINGAALARLAASRGVSTALAEAADFGAGASSNTSKLIHGGLRYLESADFGLVRDAVQERSRLLSLAPHLVRQERFLFPICRFSRHGRFSTKLGMTLYDVLAGSQRLRPHGFVPASELRALEPDFLPGERNAAYAYSDCVMNDARLTLETVLDAEAQGATVWNYHRVSALSPSGPAWDVTLEDRLTGREKIVSARRVALALGPWTDASLRGLLGETKPRVRLSQGSHLVVRGIPAQSCFLLPVPGGKRYFFVLPFHGLHLVGTTEVELRENPGSDPGPAAGERDELLDLARRYFPGADPEVVVTFTGVRPLAVGGGSTVTLSREHVFHALRDGLFAAVGGKYTTHRVLARDFFCFIFGRKKSEVPLAERPYPGAFDAAGAEGVRRRLEALGLGSAAARDRWVATYGARALALAQSMALDPESARPLADGGVCAGEIRFSAEREHCRTAVDFFRRRTGLYFTADAGLGALPETERILSERNGSISLLGDEGDYRAFLKRHGHRAAA